MTVRGDNKASPRWRGDPTPARPSRPRVVPRTMERGWNVALRLPEQHHRRHHDVPGPVASDESLNGLMPLLQRASGPARFPVGRIQSRNAGSVVLSAGWAGVLGEEFVGVADPVGGSVSGNDGAEVPEPRLLGLLPQD